MCSGKEKPVKKHLPTIILIAVFLTGLSLVLYPSFSDYWNSFHQSRAVASYAQDVADLDNETYQAIWKAAEQYNTRLFESGHGLTLTPEEQKEYEKQLAVSNTGIMAYIEIPKINCSLAIYHGTDDAVLQVGVGHLEGTSLPVGGKSTHCVLSGHRGLPSAKLFSNLDKLAEGDLFMIRTLDETLTYEVDQILIVLPEEVGALSIVEGKDYCTLVTCTPYGVNTHRLLVRGHRVDNVNSDDIRVTADAMQIEAVVAAPAVAVPLLLLLLLIGLLNHTRKRKDRR